MQLLLPSRERGSRGCLTSGRACRCRRMHLSFTNDKARQLRVGDVRGGAVALTYQSSLGLRAREFVAGIAHAHFRFFNKRINNKYVCSLL